MSPNVQRFPAVLNELVLRLDKELDDLPSCAFPDCKKCQDKLQQQFILPIVSLRFPDTWPKLQEIKDAVATIIPCPDCQGRFKPQQIYDCVVLLMRCWAIQGAAPREIQEALNVAESHFGDIGNIQRFVWCQAVMERV
jgi:hypothetical protein